MVSLHIIEVSINIGFQRTKWKWDPTTFISDSEEKKIIARGPQYGVNYLGFVWRFKSQAPLSSINTKHAANNKIERATVCRLTVKHDNFLGYDQPVLLSPTEITNEW